jgi:hypothetical protein
VIALPCALPVPGIDTLYVETTVGQRYPGRLLEKHCSILETFIRVKLYQFKPAYDRKILQLLFIDCKIKRFLLKSQFSDNFGRFELKYEVSRQEFKKRRLVVDSYGTRVSVPATNLWVAP